MSDIETLLAAAQKAMPDSLGMVGLREYDAFMDLVAGLTPRDVIALLAKVAALEAEVAEWRGKHPECSWWHSDNVAALAGKGDGSDGD